MSQFACGYILSFDDNGPDEEQVLHIGSEADCKQVLNLMSAVSYSGDRPLSGCKGVIAPIEPHNNHNRADLKNACQI